MIYLSGWEGIQSGPAFGWRKLNTSPAVVMNVSPAAALPRWRSFLPSVSPPARLHLAACCSSFSPGSGGRLAECLTRLGGDEICYATKHGVNSKAGVGRRNMKEGVVEIRLHNDSTSNKS